MGLDLPADMRVLLYQNQSDHFSPESLLDPSAPGNGSGGGRPAEKFAPLIDAVRQYNEKMQGTVSWSLDQADDEVFQALPLRGAGNSTCCSTSAMHAETWGSTPVAAASGAVPFARIASVASTLPASAGFARSWRS